MRAARMIAAFIAAVITSTVIGAAIATQFIIAQLQRMQIEVPVGVRVQATFHDIFGMFPLYSLIVGGALLIAFPVAALIHRLTPWSRRNWLMTGGFAAVIAALLLVEMLLGGTPVAGARGAAGLLGQGAAGIAGGWVFARLWPNGGAVA